MMQKNRQEYQLTSVDQALMDELTGRVRDCYRQMTEIALRAMEDGERWSAGMSPLRKESPILFMMRRFGGGWVPAGSCATAKTAAR